MKSGAAKVLAALKAAEDQLCSGEDLSGLLAVSRNQIWKHVESLRELGYEIDGAAGGGYRLLGTPDRLLFEEIEPGLETHWLARNYHYFPTTDSTNRVAFELARQGAPHGTTVVAEEQTQGRGRLDRSFFSPGYQNLYTSIVVRPAINLDRAATSVLASAVGVAEAIASATGDPSAVEIKWPNDVLLGGLKTSGILMELQAEATRIGFLILGIGINLNTPREDLPADFRASATSLSTHSKGSIDRVRFAQQLYNGLEEVLDLHFQAGFEAVRPRFDALFRMVGERVTISGAGDQAIDGTAIGIAEDGALLIRTDSGTTTRVLAGDVRLTRLAVE